MNDVICVGWRIDGRVDGFVDHSISDHFAGAVPAVGDRLALILTENDAREVDGASVVVDRFCLYGDDGAPYWHIVLEHTDFPADYAAAVLRSSQVVPYEETPQGRLLRKLELRTSS